MVTSVVPTGSSSAAARILLQTMQTVSDSNANFLKSEMTSISAHTNSKLSAGAMFSILETIAASRNQIVSTVKGQAETMVQAAGLQGDLDLQFGAIAVATMSTTSVQIQMDSRPDGGTTRVSVTTASLQINGSQSIESDPGAAMMQEYVRNYVADNSLSSEQISDALYSGESIGESAVQGASSFKDAIREIYADAEAQSAMASNVATWLANGRPPNPMVGFEGQSDEQVVAFISGCNKSTEYLDREASSMTAAFEHHTLTFEKASDVQELDYSETIQASAFVGRSGFGRTVSMNQDLLRQRTDGKQNAMLNIGNVELYATW